MGRRGPAPTPIAMLARRGSWRADANKNEPQPAVGAPPCPLWLSVDAKIVWEQMVSALAPLGVLTEIDGNALARYCDAFVRWKAAAKWIDEKGEFYPLKDDKGKTKCLMPFPQVATYKSMAAMLLKLEQEFGLTPASRTRIQVPGDDKPANDNARFFRGPRAVG